MAAAAKTAGEHVLGLSAGPEGVVLFAATNIDVNSNIDFSVVGPCDAVEVVVVSGTAKTGTPSVVFTLQGFNPASGLFEDLVAATALTDIGNKFLLVGAQVAVTANVSAQRAVRERLRLKIAYTGTPVTDVLNNVTACAFIS